MKPDWQNKSYAKNGAVTGSSTMHSKLKVGTSSLHSKIAAANNNMPQAPKPAVRKFADGGAVRTRSDDEIGDTNPRTGKVDPGSYDRRMAQGEKNLQMLKDAFNKFTGDKAATQNVSSDTNAEYKAGGESDAAKAKIISAAMEKKPEASAAAMDKKPEASAVKTEEPSFKADVLKAVTAPKETKVEAAPAPAAESKPAPVAKPVAKKRVLKPVSSTNKSSNTSRRMTAAIGQSQKDIEELIAKRKKDAGRKAAADFNKLWRSR
jgi:hypothetical protein